MKYRYIILFFSILLFLSNSTGFDFYSHSVMYYYHNEAVGKFYSFFDLIVLPRYFLLSYIYEFSSVIGVPLAYIAIILILYPLNTIIKIIEKSSINNKVKTIHIVFLFMTYLLSFFYSGLSLSFLWGIAYFVSGKRIFLIGLFFHPVGIILYLMITASSKVLKFKYLIIAIFLFLSFVIIETYLIGFFTSGKLINGNVLLVDLSEILAYSDKLKTKVQEIKFLFIILLLYLIFKKYKFNFTINYSYIIVMLVCFSLFISVHMLSKPTLLYYLFSEQSIDNYAIYISWFDFGVKDLDVEYRDLRYSRHEHYDIIK